MEVFRQRRIAAHLPQLQGRPAAAYGRNWSPPIEKERLIVQRYMYNTGNPSQRKSNVDGSVGGFPGPQPANLKGTLDSSRWSQPRRNEPPGSAVKG